MNNTIRISIFNDKAKGILNILSELDLISINEEYESLYIAEYVAFKPKIISHPKFRFEFCNIAKHETKYGKKIVTLTLSLPIPLLEIPKSDQHPKIKYTDNVTEIIVHEEDFNTSKGFDIDENALVATYESDSLFLEIDNGGHVFLLSKPLSEYSKLSSHYRSKLLEEILNKKINLPK